MVCTIYEKKIRTPLSMSRFYLKIPLNPGESLIQIGNDVVYMFRADG